MGFRKLAFVMAPAITLAMASASTAHALNCNDVNLKKGTPVPFVPFPLENKATGEKYLPTQQISVGGKMVLAKDYFDSLNKTEQDLNAWGYSLRDTDADSLQEIDNCIEQLKAQITTIEKDRDTNPPAPWDLAARQKDLENKWNAYKQNIPNWDELWRKADSASVKVNLPTPPPFTAPVPQAARVDPKDVFKKRTWSFEHGDKSKFWVAGNASVQMTGSRETTKLEATGAFNAAIMGLWDGEVLSADATAQAGKGQDPKVSFLVKAVGKTVWNPSYPDAGSAAAGTAHTVNSFLHKNDEFTQSVDQSASWRFAIGPVPCAASVGFRGTAGIAYGYDVALTALGGFAGPKAEADAYVQAGVDIGIASAGVRGTLVLINDELTLRGDATVDFVDEPKVVLDLSATNQITALSGNISVYAKIDLLFTSWEGDYKIWGWDGYKATSDIFHFKYTWTSAGASAEGDVQAEDLAEVAAANHDLQVAQLDTTSQNTLYAVMQAVATDLSSAEITDVAAAPTRFTTIATSLDSGVSAYLADVKKWLKS